MFDKYKNNRRIVRRLINSLWYYPDKWKLDDADPHYASADGAEIMVWSKWCMASIRRPLSVRLTLVETWKLRQALVRIGTPPVIKFPGETP